MKIFLTGSTGFIGRHLLDSLSKNHEVAVLVRNVEKVGMCSAKASKVIIGDLRDAGIYEKIPNDIDLICHAAGVLGKWGIKDDIYKGSHIQGAKNVIQICLKKRIKRLIYISTAGVLGSSKIPLDEHAPYKAKSVYELTKAEAEKFILESSKDGGIQIHVLRPEFVYGEGNTHIVGLFQAVKERKFFLVGRGDTLLHPTYIGDLVQILNLIIASQKASDIYMVVGERCLTVEELASLIAKLIGVPAPKFTIPSFWTRAMASIFEIFGTIFNFEPVLTHSRINFFTQDKSYSTKRAITELGYKPIRLEEGLKRTINWYARNGFL